MSDDTPLPFELPSVCRKKLTVDFNGGNQSSNGGVLLLRESERSVGVCRLLANTMTDRRDPNRIRHEVFEMVMAAPVAHERQRGDTRRQLLAGVVGRWKRLRKDCQIALKSFSNCLVVPAQAIPAFGSS